MAEAASILLAAYGHHLGQIGGELLVLRVAVLDVGTGFTGSEIAAREVKSKWPFDTGPKQLWPLAIRHGGSGT